MQLLDEIIEGAVDDKISLPSLLRKCLLLAHQLRNAKLKAWVEYELNGYPNEETLPEYRQVRVHATGTLMARNGSVVNNQPLAASVMDEDHRHWAERSPLMQPIAAYDIGKDEEGKPNGGRMPWPAELVGIYANKFSVGWTLKPSSEGFSAIGSAWRHSHGFNYSDSTVTVIGEDDDTAKLGPS